MAPMPVFPMQQMPQMFSFPQAQFGLMPNPVLNPVEDINQYTATNPPNPTLYVNTLNERVKLDGKSPFYSLELKEELHKVFSPYGTILSIHAKKNIRMKGQAFVVYDDLDVAKEAVKLLQGYFMFQKPMVRRLAS